VSIAEIRTFLAEESEKKGEGGWWTGPLAREMETITELGLADTWEQIPMQRRIELMAWVRTQRTMRAWEQWKSEHK